MESMPLMYYAAVCAAVSLLSPVFGGLWLRLIIGAVVGAGSALAFPSFMALVQ